MSLLPVTRRTWSPRGQTPILRHRCNWKRASMAGVLGYHASDADRGPRLCFHVQKDSYNTQTLIGVLDQLKGFYAGLDFPPWAGHRGYAAKGDDSGWSWRCWCSHSSGGR
jgi:hypothetical protein